MHATWVEAVDDTIMASRSDDGLSKSDLCGAGMIDQQFETGLRPGRRGSKVDIMHESELL